MSDPGQPLFLRKKIEEFINLREQKAKPEKGSGGLFGGVGEQFREAVKNEQERQRRQRIVEQLEKPQRQFSFRAASEGYTPYQSQAIPLAEEEEQQGQPVSPPQDVNQPTTPPVTTPTEPTLAQKRALEREMRNDEIRQRRGRTQIQ